MKCPADGATLVMTERQGVEIDYCPDCRGVWLDRGELDKIIERADADDERDRGRDDRDRDPEYRGRDDDRRHSPKKKKKSSFFSEMFESFGGGEG